MKLKKIFMILSIIAIFLLLTNIFTGCIQKEKTKRKNIELQSEKKFDKESVLPNWKDGDYHDYSSMTKLIKTYDTKYADLVDVFSIGKSVEDRDIWCMKLTNEKNLQDKYVGVIDGGIHGNEWESTELCLYFAEYLLVNFGKNNTLTGICNSTELYFVPMLNPDGREVDNRYNANGIDLNRNFDVHFGRLRGGNFRLGKLFGFIKIPMINTLRQGVMTNCGRRAFSEPETAAFREFMESLDSKKLSFYVDCHTAVHGVGSVFNVGHRPEFLVKEHEKEVLNNALYWVENHTEYDIYPVDDYPFYGAGFIHHWVFKEFRIPAFIFELLSQKYEPGYKGGGPHDNLVHWMKASIPVLIFFVSNTKGFYNWNNPAVEPVLNEIIPPKSI